MKSTASYWNPLAAEHEARWEVIDGSDGNLMQLTVSEDPVTGDYTRLTRFRDGAAPSFRFVSAVPGPLSAVTRALPLSAERGLGGPSPLSLWCTFPKQSGYKPFPPGNHSDTRVH